MIFMTKKQLTELRAKFDLRYAKAVDTKQTGKDIDMLIKLVTTLIDTLERETSCSTCRHLDEVCEAAYDPSFEYDFVCPKCTWRAWFYSSDKGDLSSRWEWNGRLPKEVG